MNVQAEFDQMIHNVMSAINQVLEEAESNPATMDNTLGTVKDFDLFVIANPEDRVLYDMGDDHPAGSVLTELTITNAQINMKFLQDPTIFTFRTVEGNEDTDTMRKLKEAFTTEKYALNPNVATKNSFITYYNSLVSQVANSGDVNKSIAAAQEQTVSSISAAREQIVGVSSDEELEYMIQFQNAYNASSRYINVVSEMLEHLVNTLGA